MDTKATGALIAARRKQLALSQAELAERLYVTDKAVSRWETGRGMPGLDSLEPLAEILGLSVSELISGKELTTEELPKAAGGQIMESMKREHQWKWLAWLAMAAVTLLAVWGISISAQAQRERSEQEAHYAASVHREDLEGLAQKTADYFRDWNPAPRFNEKTLAVRECSESGDYLALLCSDRAGEWCMSLWQKDAVFPDRYQPVGGRVQVEPGIDGLLLWNFGDAENAVVVVSGVELPEEACRYSWSALSMGYTGIVDGDGCVLDVFLVHDVPETLDPMPHLYDGNGNWIWQ